MKESGFPCRHGGRHRGFRWGGKLRLPRPHGSPLPAGNGTNGGGGTATGAISPAEGISEGGRVTRTLSRHAVMRDNSTTGSRAITSRSQAAYTRHARVHTHTHVAVGGRYTRYAPPVHRPNDLGTYRDYPIPRKRLTAPKKIKFR